MINRCCQLIATSVLTFNISPTSAAQVDFIQGEENLFLQGQFHGEDRNGNRQVELSELKSFFVTLQSNQPSSVLYSADLADLSSFAFIYAAKNNNFEDTLQFRISNTATNIDLDASTVAGSSTIHFNSNRYFLEGPLGLPIETETQVPQVSPQGVPETSGILGLIGLGALGLRSAAGAGKV